jgi:hypothetical protein
MLPAALQLPEALPAALHSWQHPGSSFSGEAVAELLAATAGKQLLQQRLAAWRRSLRSLYYQLRHGGCQAFYVVAQQVRGGAGCGAGCSTGCSRVQGDVWHCAHCLQP